MSLWVLWLLFALSLVGAVLCLALAIYLVLVLWGPRRRR